MHKNKVKWTVNWIKQNIHKIKIMILKSLLLYLFYEIKIGNFVNYLFLSGDRHRSIFNNILIINHKYRTICFMY